MNSNGPESLFVQADRLIEENKSQEAMAILQEILHEHPGFGRAYNHLAFIYETKLRDYVRAEENYRKCLELSPDYPAVYLNYAILLSGQERFDEVKVLLEKAMDVPGMNKSKVYNEYGIMHEMGGDLEQAIYYYKAAIQKAFSEKEIEAYQNNISRVRKKMEV
ncbi:MAG: tetratricopeptide repeat protein [Bacteroidia bacterium]|nr:tetratricopeptide repeat protein [Bacteroidia bacterium]